MKDKLKHIKALITTNWSHPKHKFFPGDFCIVEDVNSSESKKLQARKGQKGVVIARSTTVDGFARSYYDFRRPREYTRYYVLFEDGYVGGFHSHYLKKS